MYEKIVLKNGVRVVYEKLPYVRSASLGIFVGNGSRYEPASINGVSHFIEHMVFKGTEKLSAIDIARTMDSIGGQINASTGKESTSYYLKTLDTHLDVAIDVLCDMFFNSKFCAEEVNLERGVINEEISMYEDTPEDIAVEKLNESCYDTSALGKPILGTRETLDNIDSSTMIDYIRDYYKPKCTVVSLCGSFEQKHLDKMCALFENMQGTGELSHDKAEYHRKVVVRPKDFEQNHLCLGFESIPFLSEDRYKLQLLNAILGGNMSSRLFQEVREKHGLCYSVYSFNSSNLDSGMFCVYTGLNKSTEKKAIELILKVIRELVAKKVSEEELTRVREQVKANILMNLESTAARMNSMGKGILFMDKVLSPDELSSKYDEVTKDDIYKLANDIFKFENSSICAVGKTESQEYYSELLLKG